MEVENCQVHLFSLRFNSSNNKIAVLSLCTLCCCFTSLAEAKNWDIFTSPTKNQLECFYENGLSKNKVELLKNGRPEDKKLRKKAKKALQVCMSKDSLSGTMYNKSEPKNASTAGADLQILILKPSLVADGTTILVLPNKTKTGRIIEISNNGEIIWEYLGNNQFGRIDDAKLTKAKTILVAAEKGAYEIDRSGTIIWSYSGKVSHDIDRLDNGNTILNYAWGPKGDTKIVEVNRKGLVVWTWDGLISHDTAPFNTIYSKDHSVHGSRKTWIHNNALTVLPNDNILISLRDFQEIVWIDRSGQVKKKYRFKCQSAKRALQTSGIIKGCNPHEPQVLKNGNIVVGLRNPDRAIEFDPETSEIIWQWRAFDSKLYGTIRDVDKLINGNYQVVTGGHLLEITPKGEVVMNLGANPSLSKDHRILYKAQKIYSNGDLSHD